ncbi:terminase small subunit [uncultured Ruegeria sp.]|uniref:terminase small subunit n=1 Tax=uncultured Ruegeria sp. TaxID=259304 RepID=UPI002638E3CB|nr:terminase small subunit [uncultured Ruegeria sp.]
MTLTAKQERFVEEYLIDANATQAAIRAGYSEKTAFKIGSENLIKPKIAELIAAAQDKRSEKTEIDAERVLTELGLIGFLDPAELVEAGSITGPEDIPNLPEHVRRAIAGWSWDKHGNFVLKIADKLSALEKIGKHVNVQAFRDQLGLGGPDGGPIKTIGREMTPQEAADAYAASLDSKAG